MKSPFLVKAAVAGLIGASAIATTPVFAATDAKGHCMGANKCKGKGDCAVPGQNDCNGQNKCKGKSFTEMTKAECDKLAKKNKKIHFVALGEEDKSTKTK